MHAWHKAVKHGSVFRDSDENILTVSYRIGHYSALREVFVKVDLL